MRWESNAISNGEEGLSPFYEKLIAVTEAGAGFATIYHIGDSHVASKAYPNSLAGNLQNYFGYAGSAVTANNPVTRKRPKTRTRKKATKKKTTKKKTTKKKTTKKKTTPKKTTTKRSGAKSVTINQQMNRFYQANYLTASDVFTSLGNGEYYQTPPDSIPDPIDSVAYTEISNLNGIRYYAYGDYGKTFAFFAESDMMVRQLAQYKPDLVIISLGTNDVWVNGNSPDNLKLTIERLISRIKETVPDASFLLTTAPDGFLRRRQSNPNLVDAQTAVIEYCDEKGYAYWDLYTIMGGAGSMKEWQNSGFVAADLIHFTPAGYEFIAKILSDAIIRGYEQYVHTINEVSTEVEEEPTSY